MAHRNDKLVYSNENPNILTGSKRKMSDESTEVHAENIQSGLRRSARLAKKRKLNPEIESNDAYESDHGTSLENEVETELESELENELESELENEFQSDHGSELESELENELENELGSELENELESELENELESELENEFQSDHGSELESELENELENELGSELENELESDQESELESDQDFSQSDSSSEYNESEEDFVDCDDNSDSDSDDLSLTSKSRIKKIMHTIFGINCQCMTDEDEEIIYQLADEPWFVELSANKQKFYFDKMKQLRNPITLPTIKDILDLRTDPEIIKELLLERRKLDMINKISPTYSNVCIAYLKKYDEYIKPEFQESWKKMKQTEEKVLRTNELKLPMTQRIMQSHFDNATKTIIYQKYLAMISSEPGDAFKYQDWLDTVMSLPHLPKQIELDLNFPRNVAISNMVANLTTEFNNKIYGMTKAKEELICFVTNMIQNPQSKYKEIGLCGPPGIGKTMMAQVISKVLKLPMEQISLAGVNNPTFLLGSDFVYVGSGPGAITKAVTKMKYTNGIIFFDEIDKLLCQNALLHVTDFTQNHNFRDKYMPEIPINLSDYIFVYSMNNLAKVDSTLASRLHVIHLDGYDFREKVEIIEKFLFPEILSNYNMTSSDVILPRNCVEYLVQIVPEDTGAHGKSGVRSLKKALNQIINRINLYRLAAVNGKLSVSMSFEIKNFKLPYTIDIDLIDQILERPTNNNSTSYQQMYV